VKQNRVWRHVAAAMAAADEAGARDELEALASPVTGPVVDTALRLCRSARGDERRVGVLLAELVLQRRPDLDDARALRAARDEAAARG